MDNTVVTGIYFVLAVCVGLVIARLIRYRNAEDQLVRNSIIRKKVN
jgi:hypothetical protein